MTLLKLTQIPSLNSIVIKQEGGHFFIAAKDSFIIDKAGFLQLVEELTKVGFLNVEDISQIIARIGIGSEN